jgi:hypothetical protein
MRMRFCTTGISTPVGHGTAVRVKSTESEMDRPGSPPNVASAASVMPEISSASSQLITANQDSALRPATAGQKISAPTTSNADMPLTGRGRRWARAPAAHREIHSQWGTSQP